MGKCYSAAPTVENPEPNRLPGCNLQFKRGFVVQVGEKNYKGDVDGERKQALDAIYEMLKGNVQFMNAFDKFVESAFSLADTHITLGNENVIFSPVMQAENSKLKLTLKAEDDGRTIKVSYSKKCPAVKEFQGTDMFNQSVISYKRKEDASDTKSFAESMVSLTIKLSDDNKTVSVEGDSTMRFMLEAGSYEKTTQKNVG